MSRREARISREVAKRAKQEAKSARLRQQPQPDKQVRVGANPDSIFHMKMSWACDAPDHEGQWSWGVPRQWSDQDWDQLIEPKFKEFERLTWGEIDRLSSDSGHKMHHNMDTDQICEEAQRRLIEIDRYADIIFRFRLGNRRRVWGFREVSDFQILWYDPTHMIYPTEPD